MMNDDKFDNQSTQRTVRPQEMQRERVLEREEQPMQMQQFRMQQQAGGKTCPFCGAVNDPEAMFCAQCGQPISKAA